MKYLIDPPTPFDTIAAWEKFLQSLDELDQESPDVREARRIAEKTLEELRARI